MREFSFAEEESYYYSLGQEEATWMQEIAFVNSSNMNCILKVIESFGFKIDVKIFRSIHNILRGARFNG